MKFAEVFGPLAWIIKVRVEGLRRQPEATQGSTVSAGALRGILLAAGLVLSLSGEAGAQAAALVRGPLRGDPRRWNWRRFPARQLAMLRRAPCWRG